MENIKDIKQLERMLDATYKHEARIIKVLEPMYVGDETYDVNKIADLQLDAIRIKFRIKELTDG